MKKITRTLVSVIIGMIAAIPILIILGIIGRLLGLVLFRLDKVLDWMGIP